MESFVKEMLAVGSAVHHLLAGSLTGRCTHYLFDIQIVLRYFYVYIFGWNPTLS